MRISDWSSDVCSSDLRTDSTAHCPGRFSATSSADACDRPPGCARTARHQLRPVSPDKTCCSPRNDHRRSAARRSEEHTSELQSLMRNSYAVFCLKKKEKVV